MLNRLAGSADEMASAVKTIKEDWLKMQLSLDEKEVELEKLKAKIEKLDIQKEQKDSLVEDINKVKISENIYSINLNNPSLRNAMGSTKIGDALSIAMGSIKLNDSFKNAMDSTKVDDALSIAMGSTKIDDSL